MWRLLKRWYYILIDIFYTKVFKEKKTPQRRKPTHILPIYFHKKGLDFIKFGKILIYNDVISKLVEKFQMADPPAIVYNLSHTRQIFKTVIAKIRLLSIQILVILLEVTLE